MTAIKRRLEERRARNRALAIEDAKRRCGFCKRELNGEHWSRFFTPERQFCSEACLLDHEERERMEAR